MFFCLAAPLTAQEDAGGGQKSTEIVTISVPIPKDVDEVHIKRNDDGEWVVDQPTAGEKIFFTLFTLLLIATATYFMKRVANIWHSEDQELIDRARRSFEQLDQKLDELLDQLDQE